MKLPTYQEAYDAVNMGLPTAMDAFIESYEPLLTDDGHWRKSLEAALEYWRTKDDPVITQLDATLPLPFLTDDPE